MGGKKRPKKNLVEKWRLTDEGKIRGRNKIQGSNLTNKRGERGALLGEGAL